MDDEPIYNVRLVDQHGGSWTVCGPASLFEDALRQWQDGKATGGLVDVTGVLNAASRDRTRIVVEASAVVAVSMTGM